MTGGNKTMTPNRKQIIDNHMVEEFYWNGKFVVYVDHKLVPDGADFETVCERIAPPDDGAVT